MITREFVKNLKELLTNEVLDIEKAGPTLYSTLDTYDLRRRQSQEFVDYRDELKNLMQNYNMANVEMGYIVFRDRIYDLNGAQVFADYEVHPIGVHRSSEVILMDAFNLNQITPVAKDFEHFLSALYISNDYFLRCGLDDEVFYSEEEENKIIRSAIKAAGGNKYSDFYISYL